MDGRRSVSLAELDPLLTAPKRLASLGAIAAVRRVEFAALRELIDVSDSDLSKQLKALADAGYIESRKTGRGAKRRTWLSVTVEGRDALAAHTDALRSLVDPGTITSKLGEVGVGRSDEEGPVSGLALG